MATYAVRVRETSDRTVIVENAGSIEEAMDKVKTAVKRGGIPLGQEAFGKREITPSEYWDGGKVPDGEDVSHFYHLAEPGGNKLKDMIYKEVGDKTTIKVYGNILGDEKLLASGRWFGDHILEYLKKEVISWEWETREQSVIRVRVKLT